MKESIRTKVTYLGKGWGIRLINTETNEIVSETFVTMKDLIGPAIAYLLRWHNKLGSDSSMAEASRNRFYCSDHKQRKIW